MGKIKKSIVCVCAEQNDIEKYFKPFTLGGSLIPPPLREGYRHPHEEGDYVRQAVSILGSPRVDNVKNRGWSLARKNERPPP